MTENENVAVVIMTANKIETYQLLMSMVSTASMLVIVSPMDMNQDGKIDLVLHLDNSNISYVLYNTGSTFRSQP